MQPDTVLKLGDFTFQDMEIPEQISFGGTQITADHFLVGGARVVDSMGAKERDIEWKGLSRGATAVDRMEYMDFLRGQGKAQKLSWGRLSYLVIIDDFIPVYERFYQIPYTIRCKVIQNLSKPVTSSPNAGIDTALSQDASIAGAMVAQVGNPVLSGLWSTFSLAFSAVAAFAGAAASVVASVTAPLLAVQAQVAVLEASAAASLASVGAIGAIGAGFSVERAIAGIGTATAACADMALLEQLSGYLGRISGNLGSISGSATTITVAGGDLFAISSQQYGQAQAWTTIANANGLSDPQLSGLETLAVPAQPDGNDGVLVQ